MTTIDAEVRPLLKIHELKTWFHTRAGVVKAVNGVSLDLKEGEIVGLVGESGSGKSITGFSIMGLVDHPGVISAETMQFNGHDLIHIDAEQYRHLRGNELAMIFQDPMMTLNPTLRVKTQMIETIMAHRSISSSAAYKRSLDVLKRVGIPAAEERIKSYPHELSGGMRQRVAIAIALLNEPKLIIADEPTTALDVTIQGQILYEVQKLCAESGTALIWITHDLAVVSGLADRLAVMYAGRLVEVGTTEEIIENACHPYTKGLMASIPSTATRGQTLYQIHGSTPSLLNLEAGCAFRERCNYATAQCQQDPPVFHVSATHQHRCWNVQEVQHGK